MLDFVHYIWGCKCFDWAWKVWEYKGKSRFVCEFLSSELNEKQNETLATTVEIDFRHWTFRTSSELINHCRTSYLGFPYSRTFPSII